VERSSVSNHELEPTGGRNEAKLTETAVLKSAGLESLLKSKNSIGDLNPLKRVSCKNNNRRNAAPSAKVVVQKSDHSPLPPYITTPDNLRCIVIRTARARGVLVGVEKCKAIGDRGREPTLNDFKTSATRNAASMISNCSDWCG
jgi:hypothetical protein